MDYEIEFVVDPNLSAAEQEEVRKRFKQAMDQMIGEWQVEGGDLRAEIAEAFLSLLRSEKRNQLEADIQRLKSITHEKKFRAETIKLMMEIYLLGLCTGQEQHEAVAQLRKQRRSR